MCGIVGIASKNDTIEDIISGLYSLEYRGYDSAGLATIKNNQLEYIKDVGKINNLEKNIKKNKLSGNIVIAHTRWATHGKPSIKNSHPFIKQNCALVHNGIIENYEDLKQELTKRGYTFTSDTDTEVLINLIEEIKKSENIKLGKAVQIALNQVVGAYAIAFRHNLLQIPNHV